MVLPWTISLLCVDFESIRLANFLEVSPSGFSHVPCAAVIEVDPLPGDITVGTFLFNQFAGPCIPSLF